MRRARGPLAVALAASLLTPPARAAAPPAETYALDDAVRLALRNNAELQGAEQDITIARQRVREATFLFFPEVGLQASATRFDSRYPFALRPEFRSILLLPSNDPNIYSGQAYLSMPLFEGRRHLQTLRMAQAALKQAQSKYDAVKLDIALQTKEAYHRLLQARENSAAAEALSARLGLDEPAPPARGSGWERLEAEALAAGLRAEQAGARHELQMARLDFLKGLNRELDTPAVISGRLETQPVEVDLHKALVWAVELRPELQSQKYRAQMDELAVNFAISRRNPSVVLGMDYEVTGQRFPLKQNNWAATLGLRIPFAYDFWTQHTQKLAEQRQGEIARADIEDRVRLEVRQAYERLVYWQAEWARRETELARLKGLFESLSAESAAGAGALRAAAAWLAAERRELEALTEHILARARLERAVGRTLPLP